MISPNVGLIYQSAMIPGTMWPKDIEEMLAKARVQNQRQRVTGLLLYSDNTFLQYLEGPESQVDQVFAKISADKRHTQILQKWRGPIASRNFSEWSMGYLARYSAASESGAELITRYLPEQKAAQPGPHKILRDFIYTARAL